MKIIILTVLVTISAVFAGELPCNCRLGNLNRIVKGEVAAAHSIPWMVSLADSFGNHFCGASILNEKYILTAAHCVLGPSAEEITVRVGMQDSNDVDMQKLYFAKNIVKSSFQKVGDFGDFALIELRKPLRFISGEVEPACLNLKDNEFEGDFLSAGWGLTDRPWRHHEDYSGTLNNPPQDTTQLKYYFSVESDSYCRKHDICITAKNRDDSACNGDSGGPLMHTQNGKTAVIGVTSHVSAIFQDDKYFYCNGDAAYSRIALYKDLIDKHVQNYCSV